MLSKINFHIKRYVISGIHPDVEKGGAGKFLWSLMECPEANNYIFMYPRKTKSIRNMLADRYYHSVLFEIIHRVINRILFCFRVFVVSHHDIIIFHPQSIGYRLVNRILKNAKSIKYFVLDNSYFCIKSYNVLDKQECLHCLDNTDSIPDECTNKNKRIINNYLIYQQMLISSSKKIEFFFQNHLQKKLFDKSFLRKQYKSSVIGMVPDDIFINDKNVDIPNKDDLLRGEYDRIIVFHGADVNAKGSKFAKELAARLPGVKFIFPFINHGKTYKKNVMQVDCKWDSGLKNYVCLADMVLVPSLWSAPIEGALLKSLYYGRKVAVVETEYGFSREIPDDLLIVLPNNYDLAADIIYSVLYTTGNDSVDDKYKRRQWINNCINNSDICKLFRDVF